MLICQVDQVEVLIEEVQEALEVVQALQEAVQVFLHQEAAQGHRLVQQLRTQVITVHQNQTKPITTTTLIFSETSNKS